MSVFGVYSRYYDLLYRDKDYAAEVRYVDSLIKRYSPAPSSLLDIGCGTGRHAELFSRLGMSVVGLDRSKDMIAKARNRNPDLEFHQSDLSDIKLNKKFDVATALFHVISYLTTNDELCAAFQQIRRLLNTSGLFIFDCWHGPAVLHQLPEIRIRRIQDGDTRLVRIAEPILLTNENRVDVNFQIFVQENEAWEEFAETHSMRYFFLPEIEQTLLLNGFRLLRSEEWLTAEYPSQDTWSVVYVAQVV